MTAPNIYNYDPITGLYLSVSMARISPLERGGEEGVGGVYLVPAHATTESPPAVTSGQAAVFRNGTWSIVADHRGEVWYDADGHTITVVDLGDLAQSGLTQTVPPRPDPTEADYSAAVQAVIDQTARGRDYTDGVTCASYAGSTNPVWVAETTAFIAWRDAVWAYVYAQLAAVQTGSRVRPTIDGLIAELPEIEWPS